MEIIHQLYEAEWTCNETRVDCYLKLIRTIIFITKYVDENWLVPYILEGSDFREQQTNVYRKIRKIFKLPPTKLHPKTVSINELIVTRAENILGSMALNPAPQDSSELYLAIDSLMTIVIYIAVVICDIVICHTTSCVKFVRLLNSEQRLRWLSILSYRIFITAAVYFLRNLIIAGIGLFVFFESLKLDVHKILQNLVDAYTIFYLCVIYRIRNLMQGDKDNPLELIKASRKAARPPSDQYAKSRFEPCSKNAALYYSYEEGYLCPISLQLMWDPVVAEDGNTYERSHLLKWFESCLMSKHFITSPKTGLRMGAHTITNQHMWFFIDDVIEKQLKLRTRMQSLKHQFGFI